VALPSLRHSYDNQHDQAFLLNTLGRLWLAGVGLDWREFHADEQRARVPLPGYPFERQRYWIDPLARTAPATSDAPPAMRKDVADWFDLPVWRQAKPQPRVGSKELTEGASRYLVFADDCDVSERIIAQLQAAGRAVTVVRPAAGFRKVDDWTFTLNPRSATDYESLVGELNAQGAMPEVVCHLWGVTTAPSEATDALALADAAQWRGFFSLLFLTQALGNRNGKEPLRIVVVSNGLHAITDDEDVAPAKATVLGPCLVIPQEYPHISCRSVDVVLPLEGSWQAERLTGQLLAELAADSDYRHVAYRGTHRWTQTFEPARLEEPDGGQQKLLREGGIYLITGGLGGIGLTLAEYLAKTARARLVLVARTALPPRDEWATWLAAHDAQDESAKKIRKVQALETAGAQVLIVRADVTSRTDVEAMLAQTHERFGKLDGIIHAAGVAPGGMIQVKSPETAASVLAPKVQGTLVLEAVCADDEPDFLLLCSSLNAFIGAFGLVDHCGANAFLDAFAESRARRSSRTRILSINWDAWLDVGQAATAELSAGLQEILREARRAEPTHPLLDQLISNSPEMFVYATELSSARHWVLDEHRFGANAVVPGTGYLEMVRAAFNDFAGAGPIVMRKVFFTAPLVVSGDEAREVRVIFTKDRDAFAFRIVSRAPEADWHEHVKGNVALCADEPIMTHPLPDILSRLEPQDMSAALNAERENPSASSSAGATKAGKNFGPRWTELKRRIGIKGREAIACLELPTRFADDLHAYQLHPALLDAATGFVQLVGGGVYLPLAYESIEIKAALPGKIFSYASFSTDNPAQADVLVCDLIIMNEDGQELVKVKEYTLRRLADPALLTGAGSKRSAPAAHLTDAEVAPLGAGRTQAVKNMSIGDEGIQPADGALAFGLLMNCGLNVPRIIVTPRDLQSALKLSRAGQGARLLEAVSTLQARRQKHARPNLSVAYVPPRSEVERKVARIWQDALGVEEAGIHDNFFDMGGDSLIATLLVGRLGEAFQVDLPLRALFEAPTVAEMTNAIVQKQAAQVDEGVMQELLAQIKNLSQNELQAQLNAGKKTQD
jgi:acyl transferase domain-containing protein/acyl carrier protein